MSPEIRANMSAGMKGVKRTEQTRREMSERMKGVPLAPEKRAKITARNQSSEGRAKNSAGNKGRKHSDQSRYNMSQGLMGHPVSDETKRKLSEKRMRYGCCLQHRNSADRIHYERTLSQQQTLISLSHINSLQGVEILSTKL